MRALVTGAAGFIGSNLFNECVRRRHSVVGVDNLVNGHLSFVNRGSRHGEMLIASFDSDYILDQIKKREFDVVFHLAAVPRVGYSVEHPLETNDTNVTKTLELMQACVGNVDKFVFASSSSVYGGIDASEGPTTEDHVTIPASPYAHQKLTIEGYLRLYSELYGLDSVCLRFFNVFGPNQLGSSPYATAIASWLLAIKSGRAMRSDGTGEQRRDMCYVDNVVDACLLAASAPKAKHHARQYNVACGENVSNNEIMARLIARYPNAVKIDAPWRPGDVMITLASIERANAELGYVPRVKVWDGLERTIEWVERTPEFTSLKINT